MTKECIICGTPVQAPVESEIVSCDKDYCIHTVENSVGIHSAVYVGSTEKPKNTN